MCSHPIGTLATLPPAAPAALTATLGKIALAGKLDASGAASTQAASWVGKGVVAGAMTTAAKCSGP